MAVAYLMRGGDVATLKMILGHRSLQTTEMYLRLSNANIADQHKRFSPMDGIAESLPKGRRGGRG